MVYLFVYLKISSEQLNPCRSISQMYFSKYLRYISLISYTSMDFFEIVEWPPMLPIFPSFSAFAQACQSCCTWAEASRFWSGAWLDRNKVEVQHMRLVGCRVTWWHERALKNHEAPTSFPQVEIWYAKSFDPLVFHLYIRSWRWNFQHRLLLQQVKSWLAVRVSELKHLSASNLALRAAISSWSCKRDLRSSSSFEADLGDVKGRNDHACTSKLCYKHSFECYVGITWLHIEIDSSSSLASWPSTPLRRPIKVCILPSKTRICLRVVGTSSMS